MIDEDRLSNAVSAYMNTRGYHGPEIAKAILEADDSWRRQNPEGMSINEQLRLIEMIHDAHRAGCVPHEEASKIFIYCRDIILGAKPMPADYNGNSQTEQTQSTIGHASEWMDLGLAKDRPITDDMIYAAANEFMRMLNESGRDTVELCLLIKTTKKALDKALAAAQKEK